RRSSECDGFARDSAKVVDLVRLQAGTLWPIKVNLEPVPRSEDPDPSTLACELLRWLRSQFSELPDRRLPGIDSGGLLVDDPGMQPQASLVQTVANELVRSQIGQLLQNVFAENQLVRLKRGRPWHRLLAGLRFQPVGEDSAAAVAADDGVAGVPQDDGVLNACQRGQAVGLSCCRNRGGQILHDRQSVGV